jgi:hypothetical protein
VQPALGEARGVEGGPEAVARAGEVVPAPRGVEPRVDAAEQDRESGGDHVVDAAVGGGEELGARGATGGGPGGGVAGMAGMLTRAHAVRGRRGAQRA